MTPRQKNTRSDAERQATIHELLQEQMRLAIRHTFITVLEDDVDGLIQAALYQRAPERHNHRDGYYDQYLVTTPGEIDDLPVPRTRIGFRTQLFERYQRCQEELDEAICNRFTQDASTAKVSNVVEALTGTHPSTSTL